MSHLPGTNLEDGADGSAADALASRFDQGLSLRSAGGFGGTTSAPPPPGFGAAPDQRDGAYRLDGDGRAALHDGSADGGASDAGVRLGGLPGRGPRGAPIGTRIGEGRSGGGLYQQGSGALLRPAEVAAYASDVGRSLSAPPEDIDGQGRRSSSFANLAAALGEGLAECMDDSLQKQSLHNLMSSLNGSGRIEGGQPHLARWVKSCHHKQAYIHLFVISFLSHSLMEHTCLIHPILTLHRLFHSANLYNICFNL